MDDQPTAEDQRLVVESALVRDDLVDEMPTATYEAVVAESLAFIERRFRSMKRTRDQRQQPESVPHAADGPCLQRLLAVRGEAGYLQNAKMPHGDATAFGSSSRIGSSPCSGCPTRWRNTETGRSSVRSMPNSRWRARGIWRRGSPGPYY